MGRFARSWELTKLSFKVIGQDKEMLLFPILSAIFSLLYIAALIVPTVFFGTPPGEGENSPLGEVLYYAVSFALYFGLAFVATFFNTCVVYTTKVRFEGGDATFFESLGFALSRLHLIASWSLVAASVGIFFRLLDNLAQRAGFVGAIVLNVVRGILSMAWGVVTIFVVPAMVYNNLGPIDAIKHSIEVLKRTWGESLIRHYGLGFISALFFFLGLALILPLGFVLASVSPHLIWIAVIAGTIYFVALITVFNLANTIFNVALFVYANTGKVPLGYDEAMISGAIGEK